MKDLAALDVLFFTHLFKIPKTTLTESFFLEAGARRIGDFLRERRLSYLHCLANQKPAQMSHKVLLTMLKKPSTGDWSESVKIDLKELDLGLLSIDALKKVTRVKYKDLVKEKVYRYAFEEMLQMKRKHSKLKDLSYETLDMKQYLKDPNTTTE